MWYGRADLAYEGGGGEEERLGKKYDHDDSQRLAQLLRREQC